MLDRCIPRTARCGREGCRSCATTIACFAGREVYACWSCAWAGLDAVPPLSREEAIGRDPYNGGTWWLVRRVDVAERGRGGHGSSPVPMVPREPARHSGRTRVTPWARGRRR